MTADVLAYAVALALPIVTLATVLALISAVSQLEGSRDEFIELGTSGR